MGEESWPLFICSLTQHLFIGYLIAPDTALGIRDDIHRPTDPALEAVSSHLVENMMQQSLSLTGMCVSYYTDAMLSYR